jgi:transcriptional regulator with XRE-family HTH domain
MDADNRIGTNVRRCRLWRGMTQQQLAGAVGWTQSAVSMLEIGTRGLDSRARLRQLADALRVSPSELTGEPYPLDSPGLAEAQAGVPALQLALMEYRIGDSPVEPRSLDEMAAEIAGPLQTMYHAANADEFLVVLAALVAELQAYGRDERALRLLAAACIDATHGLRAVGQVELAWIAAERGAEAAALVGDPVLIGAAEFGRAHARPVSAHAAGLARAGHAADQIPTALIGSDPWAQEVYGMLRLTAALAAQVHGDTNSAREHADEAERVALLHGERPTSGWTLATLEPGQHSAEPHGPTWECFGPANVTIWRVGLEIEAGQPELALQHASAVDAGKLQWRPRRADLLLDTARAHYQLGRNHRADAVTALRQAERIAPPHIRASPWARDMVEVMLTQARQAAGRELRGLAFRMGLDT